MLPTSKQWEVIWFITSNLGVSFRGHTKDHAKEFISNYIEQSKQASRDYKDYIATESVLNSIADGEENYTYFGVWV